ncbi:hypothetical protein HR060_00920 [Catenovulum sp. SM1970]|uniref:FlgO family outer membrane protein n=1 Tax=Marinifaba aquimaris TaxID=2741323 RepID=UPI001571EC82|nr:FlgO family outer membrane protein [Marinifaba aquimaris]NTS75412.1 hypothetical protein [Marinifaba aquimaris]
MTVKQLAKIGMLILSTSLTACSVNSSHSYNTPETPAHSVNNYYQPQMSDLSIKAYTYMLADELLTQPNASSLSGRLAVTSFVNQQTRKSEYVEGDVLAQLGEQLEAGFIYELTKRGFTVTDFKLMPTIKVSEKGDQVWSRNVDELDRNLNAKYVLAGSISEHERGAIVNVRIIGLNDQQVITAAQGFIPDNVFWSDQNVTLKDGYLLHKGERRRAF